MAFTLYSHTGTALNYAHTWTEFYKGIDEQGPYYDCAFLFNDWQDSDTVPNQMLGKVSLSGGVGGAVSRITPMPHPLSPNLFCRSARVEGVGAPILTASGVPFYAAGFVVKAQFRASAFEGVIDYASDPFGAQQIDPANPVLWCTQTLDFDEELLTLTNSQAKWSDGTVATGVPVVKRIGLTIMDLVFHRIPYMPVPAIRSLRGKCNSVAIFGADVGTVLFKGGRTTREVSSDGTIVQSIQLRLIERTLPWYQSFRPDTLAADTLFHADGTTKIVPTADLSALLRF